MGRGMEAIERMEECVQLRKQVLGAKRPYTPASFANLTRWKTKVEVISSAIDG